MTVRGAGCRESRLSGSERGRWSTAVWTRYCGTAAKAGGQRRRRTSSWSCGRPLPTRSEVYRARDTKLDRDVALKVLPQAFTNDPDRLARFEREAKVLASLNHPNIGGIYGIEDSEGTKALVLELVEGPTLADRIAQGPLGHVRSPAPDCAGPRPGERYLLLPKRIHYRDASEVRLDGPRLHRRAGVLESPVRPSFTQEGPVHISRVQHVAQPEPHARLLRPCNQPRRS